MQQHGSADDNVPAFHSRRMNQLISQKNGDAPHQYVELKGKNHWFDGVMTTAPLLEFYGILGREADWAKLPQNFTIVIANPADMCSRGGLLVDQLNNPDQFGRIEVERCPESATWVLRTSNILRFHFIADKESDISPYKIVIDRSSLELPQGEDQLACWLVRSERGFWRVGMYHPNIGSETYYLRYLMIANGSQSSVTARNWDRLIRSFAVLADFRYVHLRLSLMWHCRLLKISFNISLLIPRSLI